MPYFAELHEAVSQMDLYRWMTHVRLSRLIGFLLILLGLVSLVTHYYLSDIGADLPDGGVTYRSRTKLDHVEDLHSVGDLRFQIDELRRIKASVNNELRELESRRQKLHGEISAYNTEIENLKGQHERTSIELQQLKMLIENTKLEQEELVRRTMPDIRAPRRLLPDVGNHAFLPTPKSPLACRMHNCFDYSRCSLTSQFPVYVYNLGEYSFAKAELDSFITVSVTHAFDASPHMTLDPNIACLFVVVIGDVKGGIQSISGLAQKLQQLPFWRGDGRNHLLVNIARSYNNKDVFAGQNTGRALIAQSTFSDLQYRNGYDIIIPPSLGISHGDVWDQLPPLVPAWRKYILSFLGDYQFLNPALSGEDKNRVHIKSSELSQPPYRNHVVAPPGQAKRYDEYLNNGSVPTGRKLQGIETPGSRTSNKGVHDLLMMENVIVETLKDMQSRHSSDGFHFQFLCPGERIFGLHAEWALCGPDSMRQDVLKQSTFSLIIAPTNSSVISTVLTQVRIYEALRFGAIPVILGEYVHLPFADELLWRQASVVLPKARVTELHYYLRAFSDSHVLDMRKQGRLFWETHFGTSKTIVDTLLAVIRRRLNIPAFPVREEASTSVFNSSFVPLKDENSDAQAEGDDILGPVEPPLASPRFQHNFSYSIQTFSTPGDPFHLYPFSPFQPPMPGEAKFLGSGFGFRPIGKGAGGSGKEFNEALGGNYPREQFTIVMLTYERESVLINAVSRLKGLPHLNKVIVVWNSPKAPADDLRWPDIGVNIHVIRTSKNSLNNRFLPYDAIETEAILSIDDDAHLRHDEIIFGFRVWREARERIVGFPGRFHAWDLKQQSWLYNSNYSCELSMVLTGAAFFHKYYAYLYSYVMPQAIRDKVDEYLNCEDLAMNFLVSHITRQAPIKVTSRWTFRCPGCPKALSVEDEHFTERHKCINFFVKIYGYMPLLYTQFRVDSVLFKTRIPHDKQKCFKFI